MIVDTGATGPAGDPGAVAGTNYATFIGFQDIPLSGGTTSAGVIAPVTEVTAGGTTTGFQLNSNGTVTVLNSGLYLVTGKVQVNATGCGQAFAVQVNGTGGNTTDYNAFSVGPQDSFAGVTTLLHLNAGAVVSNSFLSGGPIQLTPRPAGMNEITPSSSLSFLRVGPV